MAKEHDVPEESVEPVSAVAKQEHVHACRQADGVNRYPVAIQF
jgi:hypothetical protein